MIKSFNPTKKEGGNISFSPDDKYIISLEWDDRIALIDIATGESKFVAKKVDSIIGYVPDKSIFNIRFPFG